MTCISKVIPITQGQNYIPQTTVNIIRWQRITQMSMRETVTESSISIPGIIARQEHPSCAHAVAVAQPWQVICQAASVLKWKMSTEANRKLTLCFCDYFVVGMCLRSERELAPLLLLHAVELLQLGLVLRLHPTQHLSDHSHERVKL